MSRMRSSLRSKTDTTMGRQDGFLQEMSTSSETPLREVITTKKATLHEGHLRGFPGVFQGWLGG